MHDFFIKKKLRKTTKKKNENKKHEAKRGVCSMRAFVAWVLLRGFLMHFESSNNENNATVFALTSPAKYTQTHT